MPVQDTAMTSRELFEAAQNSIPNSEASSAHDTIVATDSSQTDSYWLGEYLDSQAFPQMQYEHLMFQGMDTDSQVSTAGPEGTLPLISFADDDHVFHHQQQDPQSSNSATSLTANAATSSVDTNAPASILRAQKQSRLSDCFAEDMIMTTPNLPSPTAPNSMRASPSPATARGTTSGDQSVVVKIEDEESPHLSMSSVQAVDGSSAASPCRTPSPFVEDALRSANALIHRGGTAQSPFRSIPAQTLSQVSPHVQLTAPVNDRDEMSTKIESLLQLQQLQGQAYGDNLLVGISGITDQETLRALTNAAASSSLSQDLVFGSNLRSMLIEGSSQPDYSKHEPYELALPQSTVTPPPSTLVMRNVHRSRRTGPYPTTSSSRVRNRSSSHDDDEDEDDEDDDNDRRSAKTLPGSMSPFPSSSKTSNKHSYPHKCKHPGCDRTFASVGLLKSHIVSHNEDKKYWCNLCSYDGVTPRPPAPPAWPGAPAHIPEVKRYKRNHDLLRHKREQHPPIEVKIQREMERQMAKDARKQKNAAERRERNAVGAGRNGGGRRSDVATTTTPTEVDTAAYMAIARETAMRVYYMNAGLDPGACSNNNLSSTLPLSSSFREQMPQILHSAHSGQMMQQLQALQLQQQHQQLQPQYWMHNVSTPVVQAMNNALILQQQQQYQQQQQQQYQQQQQQQYQQQQQQQQQQHQQQQHHPRAISSMDTMNANIPHSAGVSTTTNYGSGLLFPTPAPTAPHSRSGSTNGDMMGILGPSVQFPQDDADGDANMNMRGIGPTRRALARSTVSRVRGRASTVDEDQKGENFHPYAGRHRRPLHRW
ncbi:hypothetical protein BGZ75_001687 [Mortierella antarctica]|nr:hypothetical protein BGZ75_001687 [Mortierella antarctica]